MNNFNLVAPVYDRLSTLVFGQSIDRATSHFLSKIIEEDRVLVLGGGSGKLLQRIPACKEITFLDKSRRMIEIASQRSCKSPVTFVHDDFLEYSLNSEWDVIVCPFFLDCFNEEHLKLALKKISESLSVEGRLLVVDFQETNSRQLLRLMHFFFRLFARLESEKLKNIHQYILEKGFSVVGEEFYHKNLIFSRVYGNL